jgi:O-antigen/teichoic acid export membrane protein
MGFALLSPLLYLIPYFSDYVWLILAYVLCANLHYLVTDFIRAQGKYRLFAAQGVLNTALNIAFNLIFLLPLSMGVNGYVLSIVLADLCTSALLILYCRLWQYLRPGAADKRLIGMMLRYCLLLIPASVCWWITNASDRYMVTAFCGEAQNGLYAAAYKIPNLLVIAAGIFIDAWQFSAVTENRRAKDAETAIEQHARRRSLTAFFSKIFKGYAGFLFLAAAGMILLCRPMATVLFDPAFSDAWRFVPILLLATVLSALGNFSASVYMVERRGLASFVTALIGAISNIALNFCLIPAHGPLGAAIATALSYLIVFVIRLISTRRSIPYRCAPAWLTLNVVLLSLMTALMTAEVRGWVWYSLGLFTLIAMLCALSLIKNLRAWFKEHKKL